MLMQPIFQTMKLFDMTYIQPIEFTLTFRIQLRIPTISQLNFTWEKKEFGVYQTRHVREEKKNLDANPIGFYRVASLFAILLLGATLSQFVLIQECCKKFWTSRKGNQTDRLQED